MSAPARSKTRVALIAIGLMFAISFAALTKLALTPVPIAPESKCLIANGVVSEVFEGPSFDVVIQLENSDVNYYINRGLERGLEFDALKQLEGKTITIKYPDYWSPLDWNSLTRHASKLESEGAEIFNECPAENLR